MERPIEEIWQEVANTVRESIPEQKYREWFAGVKVAAFFEDTLVIETPNSFSKYWLQDNFSDAITDTLKDLTGRSINLEFIISPSSDEEEIHEKEFEDLQRKAPLDRAQPLNPKYNFDTFVVGPSNRFAHAACLAVAESPGLAYNPLFIYGGVGLGKTHLLHAIGHAVSEKYPDKRIVYLSSERFTNELINAIKTKTTIEFRNRYRNVDVLLIDDIQFIAGKESTQEEFFHTFNALYDSHKQIALSSDSPPKEIPTIEERLRSRFEMGLVADIQSPDLETRIAILRKKAEMEGVTLPDDVSLIIANKVRSNIRELEGSLIRVIAYASLSGSEITADLANSVLKNVIREPERTASPEKIIQKVAEYYNVEVEDLIAQRRTKDIVIPRQVAMYLVRNLTDLSLPDIAKVFDKKDHTTIMYAFDKIKNMINTDREMNRTIKEISNLIYS
ncbi:MAG: chromosomal replication initiator protein DnaA [bacterium]